MNLIEAVILGLVQGLTEFIPVSSSGHLIIAHELMGISETGLAFDVALHLGTLLALLAFFNKDIVNLAVSLFRKSEQTRLAWLLAAATLPAVIAGVLLQDSAESGFRSIRLVAINLILIGVVMIVAERRAASRTEQTALNQTTWQQAMVVGVAQALALIPGVSRSGSTISAGLFSGLSRLAAARFSFLLAIPITFGALLKVLLNSETLVQVQNEASIFVAGILTAFISGLLAIRFLLLFVAKHSLAVFAYYRFALGAALLITGFL